MGGFDTHDNQAADLTGLHASFAAAISAFYEATTEMGLENDVTLFTVSDFGRALIENGNGRLIPTTSVEQYAATLGRWFGLSDAELMTALPALSNFPVTDLGFMGGGRT